MILKKKLLPIRAHYFFKNAAAAAVVPFFPVIAKDLGLPSSSIRLTMTTVPFLALITKPLFGALADKFRAHKIVYLFFVLVNMAFVMFLKYLPGLPTDNGVILRCGEMSDVVVSSQRSRDECYMRRLKTLMDNLPLPCQMSCNDTQGVINSMDDHRRDWDVDSSINGFTVGLSFPLVKEMNEIYLKLDYINSSSRSWLDPSCSSQSEWSCNLSCQNPLIHDLVSKPSIRDDRIFSYPEFWMFAVVVVVAKVSARNLSTMGDTIAFKILGNKPNSIGLQMVWGGVAWGLVAVISGFAMDALSENKPVKDFTYAFYLSLIFAVFNILAGLCFDFQEEHVKARPTGIFRKVAKGMLTQPKPIFFILWLITCGGYSALIWNHLYRFIIEVTAEDGCSDTTWVKTLDILALGVQCFFGEVPFFIFSGWIMNKLGHINCMSLVLFGFGVRFTLYYFLTSAWWILPIEILSGLTYSMLYSTMLTYANALALDGADATVQGVVSGIFEGIGVTVGSLVGGQLITAWGVRNLFLFAGLTSSVLAALFSAVNVIGKIRDASSSKYGDRSLPPEQFSVDQEEMDDEPNDPRSNNDDLVY